MSAIGRHVSKLSGYAPALPTPFDADGAIDAAAFERLCDRQVQMGATALVVCGTTGEAPTLRPAEHHVLVRIAVDVARGRVPVIAGAGCNATAHAIELTKDAEAGGADAVLSVVPYYNKPVRTAYTRTFAPSPNPPACRSSSMTCRREPPARLPMTRWRGLRKSRTSSASRMRRPTFPGPRDCGGWSGAEFRLLSGDDATALGFLAQGGNGCISVTSNLAPGLCRSMFLAHRQGQIAQAQRLADVAGQLTTALFRETSPSPLKYALSLLGLMSPAVRLPLVEPSEQTRAEIAAIVTKMCDVHPDYMIGKAMRPRNIARERAAAE